MDLDLECVASFVILLQEGHFGRAATRLSLSRSALTKRIQRLEHQVGVVLLLRDPIGVIAPTPGGARFAAQAVPLLAAARAARAAAHDEHAEQTIRLGVHGRIGDFPERQHLVEVARLWGAVVPAPPSVEITPLLAVERMGVVPADHDLAEAGHVSADALAEKSLLCIRNAPANVTVPFVLGDVRPLRHARLITVDAGDSRSVISLLRPGQAAVVATGSWAASAAHPGLREVRLTDLHPLSVYAAHRRTDRRRPVRSLVELLPQVAAEGGQNPAP